MRRFSIKSLKSGVTVVLTFDEAGQVRQIDFEAGMDLKKLQAIKVYAPVDMEGLEAWKKAPDAIVMEMPVEVTFAAFYQAYPVHEKKVPAEKMWNKLTAQEQEAAVRYLPVYIARKVASQQFYQQPLSYLKEREWVV